MTNRIELQEIHGVSPLCPLLTGRADNGMPCQYKGCMHRSEDKTCNWLDFGQPKLFAGQRNISAATFASSARKSIEDIKLIIAVDRYFEHLLTTAENNEGATAMLDFPFNFPGHAWTESILRRAVSSTVLDGFLSATQLDAPTEELLKRHLAEIENVILSPADSANRTSQPIRVGVFKRQKRLGTQ